MELVFPKQSATVCPLFDVELFSPGTSLLIFRRYVDTVSGLADLTFLSVGDL